MVLNIEARSPVRCLAVIPGRDVRTPRTGSIETPSVAVRPPNEPPGRVPCAQVQMTSTFLPVDAVVVVTEATTRIGRAAALRFVERRSRVVLAARQPHDLAEIATFCADRAGPGRILSVLSHLARPADVDHLVNRTLETFGQIDVWVNQTGTTVVRPDDRLLAAQHRVPEIQGLRPMYATRRVMQVFRAQSHGTLIKVASVLSRAGETVVPATVISTIGLGGLTDSLRLDTADTRHIVALTVIPYDADTVDSHDESNVMGFSPTLPPVPHADRVARAIVQVAERLR